MRILTSYEELLKHVVENGERIYNKDNDCWTYAVANVVLRLSGKEFPICTTRKSYWKGAIREFTAYMRAYNQLWQFHQIGAKNWDNNAKNEKWLNNPYCKGEGDLGRVYGVQMLHWLKPNGTEVNQLLKVMNNLKEGIDDRGEIITMWNPGEHEQGCLRPCMYSHTFSLIGDTLHLASVQRSADVPLGSNANVVQAWYFLWWMSQVTGHVMGDVTLLMNNAHIYENQMELAREQITRLPFPKPTFGLCVDMSPDILEDLVLRTDEDPTEYYEVIGYECHGEMSYAFTTTNGVNIVSEAFKEIGAQLEAESNERVEEAYQLYMQCDPDLQTLVRICTGFKGEFTEPLFREHLEMLDLLDTLGDAVENMQSNLTLDKNTAVEKVMEFRETLDSANPNPAVADLMVAAIIADASSN